MEWLTQPEAWIALATLTALEIVLGIDNIIFISIIAGRLPESQRGKGRVMGLGLAMIARIALLLSITWVMSLTTGLFTVLQHEVSGRDLILLVGGLFLLAKSTHEIHHSLEGGGHTKQQSGSVSLASALVQIALIDIVFSLDSVITAVGLAEEVAVMNFVSAFGQQKKPANEKYKVSPGDLMLQNREQTGRQAHDPCNGQQQCDTGNHCEAESHNAAFAALRFRQAACNDGDEDNIVDAEHDFQCGKRCQGNPGLRLG